MFHSERALVTAAIKHLNSGLPNNGWTAGSGNK